MIRPSVFAAAAWMAGATALPAHAQDVSASAPAAATPSTPPVATSQPLDDRKPAIGKSIVRFSDHQFEIDGTAGLMAADRHFWLVLPAGAPLLPVDPAAISKQADGRTFYDLKRLGKISIISTTASKAPSVLPVRFLEAIVPDETAVTAGAGVLHKGDILLSVPYTYKSPLRLSEDFTVHGLFGARVLGVAGATGFDAGSFSGVGMHQRLLCLFDAKRPATYAAPDCFAERPGPGDGFSLEQVIVGNNIPSRFAEARTVFAGVKPPAMETADVTIAHPFHLELIAGSWSARAYSFSWRSEGRTVESGTFAANAQGAGYIHLGTVWLKLSRSPGGDDEIRVEQVVAPREDTVSASPDTFQSTAPRAAATGAPEVIDGVVYTPDTHAAAVQSSGTH